MDIDERFNEIDEELEGHRAGLEQHEDVIAMLSELLVAVAMSIPRDGAQWGAGIARLDRVLEGRGRSIIVSPY